MDVDRWDIKEGRKNVKREKMQFGGEHPRFTSTRSRENLEQRRPLKSECFRLMIQRLHAPIGVRGMVIASLQNAANLIIPGHKVVVNGPANLEKEEKEKAKERAKEKEKDVEEEKGKEPL